MTDSVLLELAERIEKARGEDWELNRAIVMGLYPAAMVDEPGYDIPIVYHAEPLVRSKHELPNFTASLDAAMTLVPEGMHPAIINQPTKDLSWQWFADFWESSEAPSMAATPALALCAAALRARAQSGAA